MGAYEAVSPDGRKFRIEGDTPPTESDLDEIFKAQPTEEKPGAADALRSLAQESIRTGASVPKAQVESLFNTPDVFPSREPTEEIGAGVIRSIRESKAAEVLSKPFEEMGPPLAKATKAALTLPFQLAQERAEYQSDEESRPISERIMANAPSEKTVKIASGIAHGVGDLGSFFTSPLGIATLGTGALPAAAQRAIAVAFTAQMASDLPDIADELADELKQPEDKRDYQKISRLATGGAAGALLTTVGAKHGLSELPVKLKGEPNAKAVRSDTGQPEVSGVQPEGIKENRGGDIQQPPSGAPNAPTQTPSDVAPKEVTPLAAEAASPQPTVAESQPANPDISVGPGAASPSDIPRESQLSQLTETMRGKLSPDQSISSRLDTAKESARQWVGNKKDSILSGLANVRASSSALLDGYLNLPKWTDFTKTIGEWTGADQKTALEVREFLKRINKAVPERLRQEAITNWIQADGDEALLRERAALSKPNVKKGYERALTLNDAEKTLARNIQSYLESRLDEGIKSGILKAGVKNYVNQIWNRENTVTQKLWADLFGVGTLNPNFKFAKKRIFESYFQGEQAGFAPKNKSIGNLIGVYDLSFNRALSARAMIKALGTGTASDGKPISMTSGKTTPLPHGEVPPEAFLIKPNYAPEGAVSADGRPYRQIDHWALRDWKWATKGPEGQNVFVQGDMLVHPDHYQHLNNVLKSSRLASPEGITGLTTRPLLKAGAFAKQTKLSLSPFHAVQEGVHALAHRVDPTGLVKELPEINLNDATQKSLVDHGLMVQDPRASELFSEGMTGGGLVGKIPGLGYLQTAFNDILFKDYIPRLKMAMALDALERNTKAYAGKASADQILAMTARQSNAAFGEQNYRMMGRSPTLQDLFRLALLAPDFLEARGRFVAQALKPYGREQRIALALMGGVMYVGGRILNKMLDDDPHWDKPFSLVIKGKEYRLRTVLGDVQHLLTDPRSFWYNRLAPVTRTAVEYITSRDDRGIKRSSMEQLADLASWFKPIPFQVRSDQTLSQAVLGATGVPSKKYGAQQELYEKLDKWRSQQTDPKIKEQYDAYRQETHKDSVYRPLRDALDKNDVKAAKQAYAELLKTRKPAVINRAMRPFTSVQITGTDYWATHDKPFTGSRKTERQFVQSLDEDGKKLYEKAKKERIAQYKKFRDMLK